MGTSLEKQTLKSESTYKKKKKKKKISINNQSQQSNLVDPRLSKSGFYIGSWEVDEIVNRKILHYLRKIHIGMLNNYINYTFIHKKTKNYLHSFDVITIYHYIYL